MTKVSDLNQRHPRNELVRHKIVYKFDSNKIKHANQPKSLGTTSFYSSTCEVLSSHAFKLSDNLNSFFHMRCTKNENPILLNETMRLGPYSHSRCIVPFESRQ